MENNYYNTNKERGVELQNSHAKAKSQEEAIMKIFKDYIKLSASEVWTIYDVRGTTPITSVRRAITNLCIRGDLFKSEKTKFGIYGKKEHIYVLSLLGDGNQLNIF